MKNNKIVPIVCFILGSVTLAMILGICKLVETEPAKKIEWSPINDFCSVAQSTMFETAYDLVGEGDSKKAAIANIKRFDLVIASISASLCSPIAHPSQVCRVWPHDLSCWANQLYVMGWSVEWWFPPLDARWANYRTRMSRQLPSEKPSP